MPPDAARESKSSPMPCQPVLVWDLPTRLFHWLLVLLVIASFATGKIGGAWMPYHLWSGSAIFGLLIFRIIWGLAGGHHARFSAFVSGPGAVLRYAGTMLQRDTAEYPGHNPLGGWSVLAMLVSLLVQAGTGLFANDDIFTEGPLFSWVEKATSDWLTHVHRLNQGIILILVGVHVGAIVFYLIIKHENLIRPMISGYKCWPGELQPSANRVWTAALVAGLCALGVYFLVR